MTGAYGLWKALPAGSQSSHWGPGPTFLPFSAGQVSLKLSTVLSCTHLEPAQWPWVPRHGHRPCGLGLAQSCSQL